MKSSKSLSALDNYAVSEEEIMKLVASTSALSTPAPTHPLISIELKYNAIDNKFNPLLIRRSRSNKNNSWYVSSEEIVEFYSKPLITIQPATLDRKLESQAISKEPSKESRESVKQQRESVKEPRESVKLLLGLEQQKDETSDSSTRTRKRPTPKKSIISKRSVAVQCNTTKSDVKEAEISKLEELLNSISFEPIEREFKITKANLEYSVEDILGDSSEFLIKLEEIQQENMRNQVLVSQNIQFIDSALLQSVEYGSRLKKLEDGVRNDLVESKWEGLYYLVLELMLEGAGWMYWVGFRAFKLLSGNP